ncbi:MAG: histidine kinase [Bacillus sp. (in: firmicutes)]
MFFSLRNRIFLIFTLLLTIPFLIISIIIPTRFTSIMEEQTKDITIEMMDQYSLYIDSITSQVEDLGKQVLVNQATRDWINADNDLTNTERLVLKNQLKMQLSTMMVNNSNSVSISVFFNDGTGTWGKNSNLKNTEWFRNFKDKDQRWAKAHMDPYQLSQEMKESNIISYLLPLFDISTLDSVGIIKVNFPTDTLENALRKIKVGERGRVYVVDKGGTNVLPGKIKTPSKVLSSSLKKISNQTREKGLIETTYKGEEYLVFYQKLSVGDWVLISEVTKSELFVKIIQLQRNLFIVSALIFIATILASYLQSSTIVKPLEMLRKAMGYIEHGDFLGAKRFIKTIKPYKHEVGYAINIFGHTVDRLNHLIATEYEANLRRKNAEYKALLLQINPHFMNNTLEIMGGLAAQGKNDEVVNVSVYLGRMMRYSLDTSNDIVSLKEEIGYIRSFTEILKLRYEDTIEIKIEEDPLASDLPIIKFIIQPLVENAVKYSFQGSRPPEILIKSERINDTLFLLIQDNGIGMASDVYQDMMYIEQDNETNNVLNSSGNSIGLKNVLGRLRIYYGDKFTYDIQTEHNEGTAILLCIHLSKGVLS